MSETNTRYTSLQPLASGGGMITLWSERRTLADDPHDYLLDDKRPPTRVDGASALRPPPSLSSATESLPLVLPRRTQITFARPLRSHNLPYWAHGAAAPPPLPSGAQTDRSHTKPHSRRATALGHAAAATVQSPRPPAAASTASAAAGSTLGASLRRERWTHTTERSQPAHVEQSVPLSRVSHQLHALAQLHRAARSVDPGRVLPLVRQLALSCMGAEDASLFLPGMTISAGPLCISALRLGLLDHAAAVGMTVRVPPFPAQTSEGPDPMEGVRSMLVVPVIADEGTPAARTLAVLVVVNPKAKGHNEPFTTADEHFAQLLALHTSDVLVAAEGTAKARERVDEERWARAEALQLDRPS
jgi:hypothetical protein